MRRLLGGHLLYPFPSNPHPHGPVHTYHSTYKLCITSTESLPGGACINSWIRPQFYPVFTTYFHMTRMHSKTQKWTKSETKLMWKSHSVDWKSYISTCMLTMHPLNILNMWPIIFNKLIVAGAGPVHSCMCNRLLIQ